MLLFMLLMLLLLTLLSFSLFAAFRCHDVAIIIISPCFELSIIADIFAYFRHFLMLMMPLS